MWVEKPWSALTLEELYAILRLRQRVFVVEQNCPYVDTDGKDRYCRHLWMPGAGDELQAYLRIVPPGVSFAEPSLGRVITAPEARRSGLGKELLREGLARAMAVYGRVPIRIG